MGTSALSFQVCCKVFQVCAAQKLKAVFPKLVFAQGTLSVNQSVECVEQLLLEYESDA